MPTSTSAPTLRAWLSEQEEGAPAGSEIPSSFILPSPVEFQEDLLGVQNQFLIGELGRSNRADRRTLSEATCFCSGSGSSSNEVGTSSAVADALLALAFIARRSALRSRPG